MIIGSEHGISDVEQRNVSPIFDLHFENKKIVTLFKTLTPHCSFIRYIPQTKFFAQHPLTALKTNNHKTDHVS